MKLIIAYALFNVLIFLFSSFINVCESSDSLIYCDNRPNVTIDSIVKLNDGKLYVTTDNLYARVLSITSDHLPIIADGYPKLIDENFKELQIKYTNMSALNYEFNGTQYYLKGLNGNKKKFVGFNQVWLGCPQPLCIQGGIDAILKEEGFEENTINIKIFRGKYYWEIGNYSEPPLVENAKLISDMWKDGLKPPIDAVFTTWNLNTVFFKGNKSYTFGFDTLVNYISKSFKGLPNDVNAAMYWDRGSTHKEVLFVFKDQRVWALRNGEVIDGWPKNLSNFNEKFPTFISASFIDYDDNAFIFKDSIFYILKANYLESTELSNIELKPKLVFQDFFHCNNSLYAEWGFGSYDQFVAEYYSEFQTHNSVNTSVSTVEKIQQILVNKTQTKKDIPKINDIKWLIGLIVISVIVVLSIFGVLVSIYSILKFKKKSHEIPKFESSAAMRPLMKENGNHLEIIPIEDYSRKSKKSDPKLKRTQFSDEAYG